MTRDPSHLTLRADDLAGARAAVATKHHKTATIARALEQPTGITLQTVVVDTDSLGTFTPETPRAGTPRETATAKAQWACQASGLDLGIGSEGSFFPHPDIGLITMQVEHVALTHTFTGLTVTGTATAGASWTVRRTITPEHDLDEFTSLLSSGNQRLIVRPTTTPRAGGHAQNTHQALRTGIEEDIEQDAIGGIVKGIGTIENLLDAVHYVASISPSGEVIVESDLRAHYCAPRRDVIEAAARDLAHRLTTHCPACSSIGYSCDRTLPGSPCAWCGTPTATPYRRIYSCPTCQFVEHQPIAGSERGDPGTCPECNP